jgi:ribosomal protein L11 methyltransferase
VPSGYDVPDKAPAGAIDLVVSTADGWGDGYHPTTGLSLEFLARFVDAGARPRVLDYGTGSGVLGIAAVKLGCQSVIGIDIDDEALEEVGPSCTSALHSSLCQRAHVCVQASAI